MEGVLLSWDCGGFGRSINTGLRYYINHLNQKDKQQVLNKLQEYDEGKFREFLLYYKDWEKII